MKEEEYKEKLANGEVENIEEFEDGSTSNFFPVTKCPPNLLYNPTDLDV